MSLNLPYPDLEFVPLDVLTAGEMNQIVANYEYISSQFPITKSGKNIDMYNTGSTAVYDTRLTSDAGNLRINGKRALTTDDQMYVEATRTSQLTLSSSMAVVCTVDLSTFADGSIIMLIASTNGGANGTLNGLHTSIGASGLESVSISTWGMSTSNVAVITKTNAYNDYSLYARKDNAASDAYVYSASLVAVKIK